MKEEKRTDDIEVLLERLGSLQIMNKASEEYEWSDTEILTVLALVPMMNNKQVTMSKSMVPDPGWSDRDRTKFEDWWREIWLFLKSNKVIKTDNRITTILAYLREGVVGIYTQKKLDKLDGELEIQDWDDFIKEIKTMFSDKTKAVDTKWRIKFFK